MEAFKVIKTEARQKFGPTGCLRFPEILLRFDLDHELDPEVTAHLRNCPRCWKLFDSAVHSDAELVRETILEMSKPSERCAELESLFYDDMFSGVRENEIIWRIFSLSQKLTEDDRVYMLHYLKFLSYTSTTAMERAELLEGILNGEMLVFIREDDEDVPYMIKKRVYADRDNDSSRDVTQIAAGDGDNNFAIRTVPLSNGWECEITYKGGGCKTELKLNCGGSEPPVLKYCVLPDEQTVSPMTFSELQHFAIIGGRPVYKLDGCRAAELIIPGIPESLTLYTIKSV